MINRFYSCIVKNLTYNCVVSGYRDFDPEDEEHICEPGQRLTDEGCEDCPVGHYSPGEVSEHCFYCPDGLTSCEGHAGSARDCKD